MSTTISHSIHAAFIKHPNHIDPNKKASQLFNILWHQFMQSVAEINPENTQSIRKKSGLWARSTCLLEQKELYLQKKIQHKEIMQLINQLDAIKREEHFLKNSHTNWSKYATLLQESSDQNDAFKKLYLLILDVWNLPKNQDKYYLEIVEESFKEIDISSSRFFKDIKNPINQFCNYDRLALKRTRYTTFIPKPSLTLYTRTKTEAIPHSLEQQKETVAAGLKELSIQIEEIRQEQEAILLKLSEKTKDFA